MNKINSVNLKQRILLINFKFFINNFMGALLKHFNIYF